MHNYVLFICSGMIQWTETRIHRFAVVILLIYIACVMHAITIFIPTDVETTVVMFK